MPVYVEVAALANCILLQGVPEVMATEMTLTGLAASLFGEDTCQ